MFRLRVVISLFGRCGGRFVAMIGVVRVTIVIRVFSVICVIFVFSVIFVFRVIFVFSVAVAVALGIDDHLGPFLRQTLGEKNAIADDEKEDHRRRRHQHTVGGGAAVALVSVMRFGDVMRLGFLCLGFLSLSLFRHGFVQVEIKGAVP